MDREGKKRETKVWKTKGGNNREETDRRIKGDEKELRKLEGAKGKSNNIRP